MLIEKVLAKDLVKSIEATVLAARQSADRNKQELLLAVRGSTLNVTGVGAQVEVDVLTDLPVHDHSPSFSINASSLMDVLSHLPKDASVTLRKESDVVKLQAGRSRFRLRTLPGENFTRFSASEGAIQQTLSLDGRALVAGLKLVMPAVAINDSRHYLTGVLVDVSPSLLTLVGTDGHRLHQVCIPLLGGETSGACILPREVARDIFSRTLDTDKVVVEITPTLLNATVGSTRIRSRLIDGRFPDVKRFFSMELDAGMEIDRAAFVGMLERALLVQSGGKRVPGVQLKVDAGSLTAHASNDGDDFAETLECVVAAESTALDGKEVGFNITYLLDALRQIDTERVHVYPSKGGQGFWMLKGVDKTTFAAIVMPMRL